MRNRFFWMAFTVYALMRVFSFFAVPESSFLNTAVSALLFLTVAWFVYAKNEIGWLCIAAELLLGGAGNFLSIGSLSLRTALVLVTLLLLPVRYEAEIKKAWHERKNVLLPVGFVVAVALAQAARGYIAHHDARLIFSLLISYTYFAYIIPILLYKDSPFLRKALPPIAFAALAGNCIFMFGTEIAFSFNVAALQAPYYHWFRDVADGKITDVTQHFFRIVLNEQFLLVPTIIFAVDNLIKKYSVRVSQFVLLVATLILTLNLTRIYLLALAFALAILCLHQKTVRAFAVCAAFVLLFFASFTVVHVAISRPHTLGLELIGLRLGSIIAPTLEPSSLSRLLLLPPIQNLISTNPIFGSGLGSVITVWSPLLGRTITTPQFDWGWLQILAELGIVGLAAWLFLLSKVLQQNVKNSLPFATTISLIVLTITSPIIFHVLGVVCLSCIIANANRASA